METFKNVIWIVNIFSSLGIIILVLMQHGNANFLSRMTSLFAVIFFSSCLALGYIHSRTYGKDGMDFSDVKQSAPQTKPVQHSAPAPDQIPAPAANGASAAK